MPVAGLDDAPPLEDAPLEDPPLEDKAWVDDEPEPAGGTVIGELSASSGGVTTGPGACPRKAVMVCWA